MKEPLPVLILTLSKHLNCWQIFTCAFGHHLNGLWTLSSVWKMKISLHKSCKWPGSGKALAPGSSHKSSLWSIPSLHWYHTCCPPCGSLFTPFFFTNPMFPWLALLLSYWFKSGMIWWLLDSRLTRNCCWSLPTSWFNIVSKVEQPLPQNTCLFQPKMLMQTQPEGHWGEHPLPCSSPGIPVPTPVSLVLQGNSPLNLCCGLFKWIPLGCEQ